MLTESAFLKIPELMLSNYESEGNVEAMIVQNLANGLQMELDCRLVPFANYITVEKPYPEQKRTGTVFRADLFLEGGRSIPSVPRLNQYGFKERQWLEAKSFFPKGTSPPSKTQNIGRIIKDIMRLCLLPDELQGHIRQNERYILLIFDKKPSEYLAYSGRDWLESIFEERPPEVSIDLSLEKSTVVSSIVNADSVNAQMEIAFSKLQFAPILEAPFPVYWWGVLAEN